MSTSVGEVGVEIRRRLLSVKETNGPGASGLGFVAVSAHRCQAGSGLDAPFRGSVPHFFSGETTEDSTRASILQVPAGSGVAAHSLSSWRASQASNTH